MADISTKKLRDELELAKKEAIAFAKVWEQVVKNITKSGSEVQKAFNGLDLKDAKDIAALNTLLAKSTDLTKQQTTATKEQSTAEKEAVKLDKQLKQATDEEVKGKLRLQQVNKAQRDALKDELVLMDKTAGTLEIIAAKNRTLRRERQGLNLETKKGADRLKAINNALDINNKKINENSDKLKRQKINVGNYTDSTKEALNQSGLFSTQLAVLTRIQGTMNAILKRNTTETAANATAQKGAAVASGGFSKALKVLKIALISTGIGAIVVGLGSLIAAFAGTQRGADAFSKVLIPIQTIFQKFVGFLEGKAFKIFDRLEEAFANPKQAVIDLGNSLKQSLIDRFTGFVNVLKSGGSIIANTFTILASKIKIALADVPIIGKAIDLDKAQEDLKKATDEIGKDFKSLGDAVIQSTTGITGGIDKMTGAATSLGDAIEVATNEGLLLDELIKRFEKREIQLVIPLAKARLEFQKLRGIANDLTKLDSERLAALDEAEKKQRFISASEQELITLRIKRMELEQSFNDTSRAEQLELAQLKAELLIAETAAQKKINSLIALRSGIEKRAVVIRNKENEKLVGDLDKIEKKEDELVLKKKGNADDGIKAAEEERKNLIKSDEDTAKKREEITKKSIETIDKLVQKSFDKREALIDKDLDKSKDARSKIQAGIDAGNEDAKKSLAAEERRTAELEAKKEKNRKAAQRAEAAIALLKSFGENGGDLGKTLGGYNAIIAAIQAAPSFFKGTDETSSNVIFDDKHGGVTGFVHEKEQVWSQKDRAEVGYKTRDEIKDIVNRNLITDSSMGVNVVSVNNDSLILAVNKMQTSMDNLHKQIPVQDYNYDAKHNEHIQTTKYLNRIDTIRKKARSSWA
jgi:hypothetical protein